MLDEKAIAKRYRFLTIVTDEGVLAFNPMGFATDPAACVIREGIYPADTLAVLTFVDLMFTQRVWRQQPGSGVGGAVIDHRRRSTMRS